MNAYFIRRLLLMIPTLWGITLVTFFIVQILPGGPVEQALSALRFGGGGEMAEGGASASSARIEEEYVEALKKHYGFDKPLPVRYYNWLKDLLVLDFGESYYYEEPVIDVIVERFPVSIIFGIASLLITYLICVPLGIIKALRHQRFSDYASSVVIFAGYSIPGFALLILLIVLFCGGSYYDVFPMQGLTSENFSELSFFGKVEDLFMHMLLPLTAYVIGMFAFTTMLMKNSLVEQITADYVRTAYAKGLSGKVVIVKHALRNALIPIATGFSEFVSFFFAGSILIERISGLDGFGALGYESLLNRDYPVALGIIVITSITVMVGNILSDFAYTVIDPRIDFK